MKNPYSIASNCLKKQETLTGIRLICKLLTNILLEIVEIKNDHNILLRRAGLQPSQYLSMARHSTNGREALTINYKQ